MLRSFWIRNALLTFLNAWILRNSFIAFLIVVTLYSIVGFGKFNSIILGYALNTNNVKLNLFN